MVPNLYLLRFQNLGDDVGHAGGSFVVGMDAVGQYLVFVTREEDVQVDDLQTVLLGDLLQDGDDAARDDRVADVPRRLEGGDGRAEVYLRLGGGSP